MTGFATDYINQIATTLRDRYRSGFPILKELVQNADDAGAQALAFGYHAGHGIEADHMLLQGPALWVLNDGAFKESDARAIRSFGLNAKAGDAGAIGKFGLGMKSVFHLCESFFYVASDGARICHDVLNPWVADDCCDMHRQWEAVTQRDVACLEAVGRAQPEASPHGSWFLLWIPLRLRDHVPRTAGQPMAAIIERYPGEDAGQDLDFLCDLDIDQRIGALLPLLRHLHQVRFAGGPARTAFTVKLEPSSSTKRLDHETDGIEIHGRLDDGRPRAQQLHYLAHQRVPGPAGPFTVLRTAPSWPSSSVITNKGTREPRPDKAVAEAAVMLAHADQRRGRLELQWAVFLPAEEQRLRYEAHIAQSSREYRIVLHGQFFMDAGRRGIADMELLGQPCGEPQPDAGQHEVLRQWNQALAQQAVLPGLLPALHRYVDTAGLKDDEVAALTQAIACCATKGDAGSPTGFFDVFASFVCDRFGWVRRLEQRGATWTLVEPATGPVLLLPAPPRHDTARPWQALPGLGQLNAHAYIDANAPSLVRGVADWTAERLLAALDGVGPQTLRSETALDYLASFLERERPRFVQTAQVQDALVALIRDALLGVRLAEVRHHRKVFKRLVGVLLPDRLLLLGSQDPNASRALAEDVHRALLNAPTRALPLPADLAPDGAVPAASIGEADLGLWLKALSDLRGRWASEEPMARAAQLLDAAEGVIRAAGDDAAQATLMRRHRSLCVLRVLDGTVGTPGCASLDDVLQAHAQGWLFKMMDSSKPLGHVPLAAAALPDTRLKVVGKRVAGFVDSMRDEGLGKVPSTEDTTALLQAAGLPAQAPALGSLKDRGRLLNFVATARLDEPAVVRGVRYLLHGAGDHYTETQQVLWKDPGGGNSPWVRLWRMVDDAPWCVLTNALCSSINDDCARTLKIQAVDEASVLQKLKVCKDFSRVDAAQFSGDEIDLLLGHVQDEASWRGLPLHLDHAGQHRTAHEPCYLGCTPELPPGVGDSVVRFVPSGSAEHLNQQERFLSRWKAATAAAVVLAEQEPERHWRYLLDLLGQDSELRWALPPAWCTVRWLPLSTGGTIALDSLLSIEQMQAEIADLARQCGYAYASPRDLTAEVYQHPAHALLLQQVHCGTHALPILGQMMSAVGLSVGQAVRYRQAESLAHLSRLATLQSLPAWQLLNQASAATSAEDMAQWLLPEVCDQLTLQACMQALGEIATMRMGAVARLLYGVYLQEWRSSGTEEQLREALRHLKLPSAGGRWAAAAELATGVCGVQPEYLLDDSLSATLAGIAADNSHGPDVAAADEVASIASEEVVDDLAASLEDYFEPLRSSSVKPAVGAVIGLFGAQLQTLARRWLDPIAYEHYLDYLGWRVPGREETFDHRREWMGGRSLEKALATLAIRIHVQDGAHVQVTSLTGASIEVPLQTPEQLQTLYLLSDRWRGYACRVVMHPAAVLLGMDHRQQREVLQRTAESVLKQLYNQPHADLSKLFGLFEEADQVTLDVARSMILDGLPQSLRGLPGIRKNAALAQALARVDQARRNAASARHAGRSGGDPGKGVDEAMAELSALVESDPQVQAVILAGIRARVMHNQYELASIPFELFQNADDAVSELQQLRHTEGRPALTADTAGRFVMQEAKGLLRFAHWGRPVNYAGGLASHNPDYTNDLERMLMLGASAKEDEASVTGKFGLGFKSVLLAVSTPRVWSGDLCFDVVGGCLPRKWFPGDDTRQFYRALDRDAGHVLRTTVVELPLEEGVDGQDVSSRFAALSGLLPVFARQLRNVEIGTQLHGWSPERLDLDPAVGVCVEVGQVALPVRRSSVLSRVLVLRAPAGTIVLRLGADGVSAFDRDAQPAVPSVWVTAPTRGTPARGVVVHAAFQIDTGRATLAQNSGAKQANAALADKLADELVPALADLHQRTLRDWNRLRVALGVREDIGAAQFWHGLWQALMGEMPAEDAAADVKMLDGFACRLLSRFVQRTRQVPNGLSATAATLAEVQQLRLAIDLKYLGQVLEPLSQWALFIDRYPPQSWCSRTVRSWLERAGVTDERQLVDLSRGAVVAVMSRGEVAPSELPCLSSVLRTWPQAEGEFQGWRKDLGQALLQSKAGTWASPRILWRGHEPSDLVARFAPNRAVLDPAYTALATDLAVVMSYLPPWQNDAATMAEWCLAASREEARAAVAAWLVFNLYDPVFTHIRARRHEGRWLFDLTEDSPCLAGLAVQERRHLLEKLGLYAEAVNDDTPTNSPELAFDLRTLRDWWCERGEHWLKRFDAGFWPSHVSKDGLTQDEPLSRSAWMTLFALGLLRRYGRVNDEQHRGFLEFLDRKGWWITICEADPDQGAEEWMGILRDYGKTHQTSTLFEAWMDSFPRLYRVARWFDDYVQLFRTLDYRDSVMARCLLSPASDPSLAGSDIDAPTLRGMLRLGQHLVVRELLRVGVLHSDTARELAYAPRQAVVNLMLRLGYEVRDSQGIHAALVSVLGSEGATFDGAYDIPLQLVATDSEAFKEAQEWTQNTGLEPDYDEELS